MHHTVLCFSVFVCLLFFEPFFTNKRENRWRKGIMCNELQVQYFGKRQLKHFKNPLFNVYQWKKLKNFWKKMLSHYPVSNKLSFVKLKLNSCWRIRNVPTGFGRLCLKKKIAKVKKLGALINVEMPYLKLNVKKLRSVLNFIKFWSKFWLIKTQSKLNVKKLRSNLNVEKFWPKLNV